MKTLPNGIKIFNATPHVIRFWREDWEEPVEIEPDEIITAVPVERVVAPDFAKAKPDGLAGVTFVRISFQGAIGGSKIADRAYKEGADVVVGSIIAAQAYPGVVFAMTPAKGYERVPPSEKRMRPDKFTVF